MCVNPYMETNLKREAAARGIAADRIIAAGKIGKARHLGRQRLADSPRTRYYTSHTTGSERYGAACGADVSGRYLCRAGDGSLLRAAGLPTWSPRLEDLRASRHHSRPSGS